MRVNGGDSCAGSNASSCTKRFIPLFRRSTGVDLWNRRSSCRCSRSWSSRPRLSRGSRPRCYPRANCAMPACEVEPDASVYDARYAAGRALSLAGPSREWIIPLVRRKWRLAFLGPWRAFLVNPRQRESAFRHWDLPAFELKDDIFIPSRAMIARLRGNHFLRELEARSNVVLGFHPPGRLLFGAIHLARQKRFKEITFFPGTAPRGGAQSAWAYRAVGDRLSISIQETARS